MIQTLLRKSRQVLNDPVLRRFLLDRALGRLRPPPPFVAGRPPYLGSDQLSPPAGLGLPFPQLELRSPGAPITLALPGRDVTVAPGEEAALMSAAFSDTETLLGLHRFAWLPLVRDTVDPSWVTALWQAWAATHGTPDQSWAWHPYTAAERAINLLDFAAFRGLPADRGEVTASLISHALTIAGRLEYFGEHHTGNHMANNGRGLALIGLALGWTACADMGFSILLNEAERIFMPSGMLREGSSHYHMLVTRGYASAWLAARAHGRPETVPLERVVRRALAAAARLVLPGRFPLIGDISPDCPPEFLLDLLPGGAGGWVEGRSVDDRAALSALGGRSPAPDSPEDGWLNAEFGPWAGLWHVAPRGWSHMPGHGHQDVGAAELHWRGQPLFLDLGRGAYGDAGDAALYRSAWAHAGLMVDGADPYPPNRPYYDERFRELVGGPDPVLRRQGHTVELTYHGFKRLGAGTVTRCWSFEPDGLVIEDRIGGRGKHGVERRLPTPWPVRAVDGAARIEAPQGAVLVRADAPLMIEPATLWTAYGRGQPASIIVAKNSPSLPWSGRLTVEAC